MDEAALAARLDPVALRRLLARTPFARPLPDVCGDAPDPARRPPGEARAAAVLLPIVGHAAAPTLVLTQRTAHLAHHAGQISLPGGRLEPGDRDAVAAALRESEEEIGLRPDRVEILGELPPYRTITNFLITPVVGWVTPPVSFVPDPFEVAEVFEVPLAFALNPSNVKRDSHDRSGTRRQFFVVPYEQRYIWGATAGILVGFSRLLHEG